MIDLSQIVFVIGKNNPETNITTMLGTGFLVSQDGKIVTARHVVGNEIDNLVILLPDVSNIDDYQDTSNNKCRMISVCVDSVNPITDIAVLKAPFSCSWFVPSIESFDNNHVGERIGMYGFPHCVFGRKVLTYQEAEIGAKMLLETSGVKSKYATINIQTRPGQSGSVIYSLKSGAILGMLIGTYAPSCGISIAGINPHELNQSSYCISANHIKEML